MLKWVSRSSNLESDKTLRHCPESPSYTDSPEVFFSPRGDLSSNESPARLPPVFQLSSSASLDSGVGSSTSSSKTLLKSRSTLEPEDQSDSLDFFSISSSVMLSLPCLLQFPVKTAEGGGLVFILIYGLVLVVLVWPCLYLQVMVSRLSVWWRVSPLTGGVSACLLLVSLLASARYSGDTATAMFYLHQAVSQPSPWAGTSSHHHHHQHSPTFLTRDISTRHTSQSPQRQYWERKLKQEDSPFNLELMISTLAVWSLILLTVLLCNLPRLRRLLRLSHLLLISLTSVLFLKSLAGAYPTKLWRLVRPDLTSLSDPETWSSALVLAGLSTNFTTGAIISLSRGKVTRQTNTYILASLASHLVLCLVFSLTVMSLMSEGPENIYVLITESLPSPAWMETALVLVTLLGFHSVHTTISVSLTALHQIYPSPARLYPSLVCLVIITISLSLLPHWASTAGYSKEILVWTVEKFPFLLQAFILASLTWGVGLDNIAQRISAAGGGELSRFYNYYGVIAPLALLLVTAFISVNDRDQRDVGVGCAVFLVMMVVLLLSSAVLISLQVRRGKQKHLGWRQILVEEIFGRKSEEARDKSLTNSYRKFERCDLTNTSIFKIKTNTTFQQAPWQYRKKDGRF